MRLLAGPPAHGGSVVARAEGKVVLVHYALPGEEVEAESRGRRGGVEFANAVEVFTPAAGRVLPPCPHFGICGGCQWQHAAYALQLEMKRRVVEDAWQRANLRLPPDTPVLGMENPWRYRIRGEFEALPGPGGVRFGFHRLRSHSVFPITTCPIHHERIERGLFAFQQAVNELSVAGIKHLHLTAQPDGPGLLWQLRVDGPPIDTGSLARRVAELLPDVLLLDDSMDFGFWGLQFRLRSDTFVQANHGQMQVLYRTALDMLAAKASDAVLDLYAGIGTISLAVARDGASVTAVEENPQAVNLGRLAARINALENVRFLPGKVENALRKVRTEEHAAVVMDPPRAGLDGVAIAELLRLQSNRIVYVSCEPPTQVRDLSLLVRGGYRIRRAAIVDMFPQTYHIETVVLLERGSAG